MVSFKHWLIIYVELITQYFFSYIGRKDNAVALFFFFENQKLVVIDF